MGVEIEKKFLVKDTKFLKNEEGIKYCQGYMPCKDNITVRIRTEDKKAFLTVKGETVECSRLEFEYEIPFDDAKTMQENLCRKPLIEKKRYKITYEEKIWEIDIFEGENKGLIIAEIELKSVDENIKFPEWVGKEVTKDPKYYNANLSQYPYSQWKTNE